MAIPVHRWIHGTTDMAGSKFNHLVKYDDVTKKITIFRVFDPESHHRPAELVLCTELSLRDIGPAERTVDRVSQWLGEVLICETSGLRKECDLE
jgi:hypothetical protein